jgi:hypothetical protein
MAGTVRRALLGLATAATGGVILVTSAAFPQSPTPQSSTVRPSSPARSDVATGTLPTDTGLPTEAAQQSPTGLQPGAHPLLPVLRWAERGLPTIEKIEDYSATLVERERIRGKLTHHEFIFIKVRQRPFSVYARFKGPASVAGQEVIYVTGRNHGMMWAHKPRLAVTASLYPDGLIAMNNRRYPLTEIGLANLVRRLVDVGKQDLKHGECEVQYFTGAKVNARVCTVIQVVHPVPRDFFRFHIARIFVDDELKVPIRYESHDFPSESGGNARLIEEYTYVDLKLNNGFGDQDFSTLNPQYDFPPVIDNSRQDVRPK